MLDRNVQGREFKQQVIRWLEELKKEGCFPADVVIRKSSFEECTGERYDQIILAFSSYVLAQTLYFSSGIIIYTYIVNARASRCLRREFGANCTVKPQAST